jgi:hypothetical protein
MSNVKDIYDDDTIYVADTNMILHYLTNAIPGWNDVCDKTINNGGKIYLFRYHDVQQS